MPKFRTKPVVKEAFQMTRYSYVDKGSWPDWLLAAEAKGPCEGGFWASNGKMAIGTLEGVHMVSWNDWIILGLHGEIYPCKPAIFEKTYVPV